MDPISSIRKRKRSGSSTPSKTNGASSSKAEATESTVLQETTWAVHCLHYLTAYQHGGRSWEEKFASINGSSFRTQFKDGFGTAHLKVVLLPAFITDAGGATIPNERMRMLLTGYHKILRDDSKLFISIVDEIGQPLPTPTIRYRHQSLDPSNVNFSCSISILDLCNSREKFMPDGIFRVTFQIIKDPPWPSKFQVEKAESTLSTEMGELLRSGDRSDLTIKCGRSGPEFKVHELILVTRSPVFRAMFAHGMTESKQRQILIDDVDPDTLRRLLEFIYTSKIPPEVKGLCFHKLCQLIQAADKYELTQLKDVCFYYLTKELTGLCPHLILELVQTINRHTPPESVRQRVSQHCSDLVYQCKFRQNLPMRINLLLQLGLICLSNVDVDRTSKKVFENPKLEELLHELVSESTIIPMNLHLQLY